MALLIPDKADLLLENIIGVRKMTSIFDNYRGGSSMNLEIAGSSIFRNKQPEMLTYLNLLSNVTKDIFEEITVASCLITDTLVAQAFSPA